MVRWERFRFYYTKRIQKDKTVAVNLQNTVGSSTSCGSVGHEVFCVCYHEARGTWTYYHHDVDREDCWSGWRPDRIRPSVWRSVTNAVQYWRRPGENHVMAMLPYYSLPPSPGEEKRTCWFTNSVRWRMMTWAAYEWSANGSSRRTRAGLSRSTAIQVALCNKIENMAVF